MIDHWFVPSIGLTALCALLGCARVQVPPVVSPPVVAQLEVTPSAATDFRDMIVSVRIVNVSKTIVLVDLMAWDMAAGVFNFYKEGLGPIEGFPPPPPTPENTRNQFVVLEPGKEVGFKMNMTQAYRAPYHGPGRYRVQYWLPQPVQSTEQTERIPIRSEWQSFTLLVN